MSIEEVYNIHRKTVCGRMFECFRNNGASSRVLMLFMKTPLPAAGCFHPSFVNGMSDFVRNKQRDRTPELFYELMKKHYDAKIYGHFSKAFGNPDNFVSEFKAVINEFIEGEGEGESLNSGRGI